MKKNVFLLIGLFVFIISSIAQESNPKSNRELIGSSAHFNFYAESNLSNYWDSIQTPIENKFDTFNGLLDYPGGADSLLIASTTVNINLYNSHTDLDAEYSGSLASWKCGFYEKSTKTLYLCVPETDEQMEFYTNFSALAINTFSQLVVELRYIRSGGSYFPNYFKEGIGLFYSGFNPDVETVDNYVNSLGHTPILSDLEDISNIATTGLKDLIVTYIQAQVMTATTSKWVSPGYSVNIWQGFIEVFYQETENERMKLQLSSENFDFYCSEKDVQYINDISESCETYCAQFQELYGMNYGHRFNILVLPYTETWSQLTNWGNSLGASAMNNENILISSIDFCYDSNFDSYLYSLIPHEFGHVNHAHMYFSIPSGFYAEGMANYTGGGSLDANTNNSEWKVTELFNSYMSSYGRLPTYDEFLENPNNDIDPYFFGHAFCSFISDYYGGPDALKTFFNGGMDFDVLNTTKANVEHYYIKYLEYMRDWVPNSPDAAFEFEIISGDDTSMEVQFTDLSTVGANTITEWYWEFGDGTTSTEQNPTHTYSGVGSYTVYMTASDGDLYDFEYKVEYIIVEDGANYGPTITDWEPQTLSHEIIIDSTMGFNVTATDPNGDDLDYTWLVNTVGQSEDSNEFTYSFSELGSYTVECSVSDGEFTDEKSWTIVVNELNVAPTITNWEPQELAHEIYTDSVLTFSITAMDENEDVLDYSWLINNVAQTETSSEFTYNFGIAGSIYVKCIVSDGEYTDEKTWTIEVTQANLAPTIISWVPIVLSHETYADSVMNFGVTAMDPNQDELIYKWFINTDEQAETSPEFSYYFDQLGNYSIQCVVSDGEYEVEKVWTVNVYPVGINGFDFHEISIYPNPCIDVLNISTPENFGKYDLHVFRINGERILSYNGSNACVSAISIDELKTGIYFIIIENDAQVIRRKFVKK